MTEYIDREALLAEFERLKSVEYPYQRDRTEDAIQRIKNAPVADVAPVMHGRWIEKMVPVGRYFECSKCGAHENKHTAIKGRYCWRCGAKMDGDMEMAEYTNKENCTECTHHNIFWEGSGCNLLNNMEHCKFEQKVKPDLSLLFASLEDIIDATD